MIWLAFHECVLARGLARTQALVELARKLARIALPLLTNQSTYQAKVI